MSDFYNKYPYTDFHELNLDWVIERVKKLTEDWLATQAEWNDTEKQWQQLYDYVHDYFANLNVQDEINNKINQMILDGTFMTIVTPTINQTVIDATTSWLADHITQPTTPAIDTSLSIAGAAADSKTVGDKALLNGGYIDTNTDLDTITSNSFYSVLSNRTLVNAPSNYASSNAVLLTYAAAVASAAMRIQLYINYTQNTIHQRLKAANGTWGAWQLINHDELGFTALGYIDNNTDLNTVITEGYYTILSNRTLSNAPSDYGSSTAFLAVYPAVTTTPAAQINQLYFNWTKNSLWYRFKPVNNSTWTVWKQMNEMPDDKGFCALGYINTNTDLDTLETEGYYTVLPNRVLSNAPDDYANSSSFISIYPTVSGSSVAQLNQLYNNWTKDTMWHRFRQANSSTWSAWKQLNPKQNFLQNGKILADTNFSSSYSSNNVGTNFNILLYNVAHYSKYAGRMIGDSGYETYLANFKKLLQHINPDVCFICEDTHYIDTASSKASENYLYNYMLPTSTGYDETTIKSKIAFDTVTPDHTSPTRPSIYGIWNNIDGKKVLLYCAHLVPGAGDEATRLSELEYIFTVIATEQPDAYIICGDFNTLSATDRANVLQVCSDNNARLGNGSWLGWIDTTQNYSTDNIIVSDNIYINKFDVLSEYYDELFSDHNPIAINITIT